ncbi:vomeronasal type-2 receptor 116-like [Tenrec ecaudatus]|uniref:vomeronasal type-2 receptor 116-like n=1 Tax=Tenrec ecaudatus TaxID=94439 RepID=UPI003F598AA3
MNVFDCIDYIQPSVYRDGDLVLGGFFPLYTLKHNSDAEWKFFVTSPRQNVTFNLWPYLLQNEMRGDLHHILGPGLNFQNYGYVLIFLFAIEEINKSHLVLPNISLGFRLYNAFPSVFRTLESVLGWLSENEPPTPNYTCETHTKNMAVIAGIPSEFFVQAGPLLELYRTPQISYDTLDPLLKTKDQFSSLYQISPKHSFLASALVSLLIHFGWTWVGILVPDEKNGEEFIGYLIKEMTIKGTVCGEISVCPPNASLDQLTEEKLDTTIMKSSNDLYNAVHLVARALHDMIFMGEETRYHMGAEFPALLPWQLHPFIRTTQLENSAGDHVSLNENRNCVSRYDILNFVNFPGDLGFPIKVGEFIAQGLRGQSLVIQEELIEWAFGFTETPHSVCSNSCDAGFMKIPQKWKPICCFDCISCPEGEISNQTDSDTCKECPQSQYPNMERNRCLPRIVIFLAYDDPLGMALACTALGFSLITAGVLCIFVKHRDSPIVKANNRTLSYVLLLSLLLCFLCSLLFIGRPDTATCILRQITFGVVFTVAVSTVLAKTITVILAFKALTPGRTMRRLLQSGASNAVVPICSLIQLIICVLWLGTSPPFVDIDTHSEPRNIIIVCNKGSVTAFYCVLGFLGFLALGTFFLAYQARNLPDTFNEAKFLTFSMLVFCSVWVTFLPVYHSTQGKVMVAVEIFSILASSVGLLGCIFAPKCYVIFLHPDRNTSKGLRNKTCFEKK